jgi:hypothetical protein
MCELVHGMGNCERLNKFTYNKRCPIGYKREDHTRCIKDCDPTLIRNVINFKCFNQKIEYINNFDSYQNEDQCLKKYDYCKKKVVSTDKGDIVTFTKQCPPNTMKLGFICIPYCMSEMTPEMIETLGNDERYCVEDYVNLGLPFYDFI